MIRIGLKRIVDYIIGAIDFQLIKHFNIFRRKCKADHSASFFVVSTKIRFFPKRNLNDGTHEVNTCRKGNQMASYAIAPHTASNFDNTDITLLVNHYLRMGCAVLNAKTIERMLNNLLDFA